MIYVHSAINYRKYLKALIIFYGICAYLTIVENYILIRFMKTRKIYAEQYHITINAYSMPMSPS